MCFPMLQTTAVHRQVFPLFFSESCGLTRREKQIFFFFNQEEIILKKGEHYKEGGGRGYCR